jgi:Tfp pilus assembly protein PilO
MFEKELETLRRNKNAQRIVELVINSILLIVLLGVVAFPLFQSIGQLRTQNAELQELKTSLAQKRESINQAEQQVRELEASVPLLVEALPLAPKQFDLLNQVKIVGETNQLTLEQLLHKAGETKEVEFSVVGTGTYAESVNFLNAIEVLPRLIQVTGISMVAAALDESADPELTFTIEGEGYYYPEEVSLIQTVEAAN